MKCHLMLPNACPIDCRVAKETQIDRRKKGKEERGSGSSGTQALNTATTTTMVTDFLDRRRGVWGWLESLGEDFVSPSVCG